MADRALITHDLAQDMIDSFDEDPRELIATAQWVVAALLDRGHLRPESERQDLIDLAVYDILIAYRRNDALGLANALDRLDLADRELSP